MNVKIVFTWFENFGYNALDALIKCMYTFTWDKFTKNFRITFFKVTEDSNCFSFGIVKGNLKSLQNYLGNKVNSNRNLFIVSK